MLSLPNLSRQPAEFLLSRRRPQICGLAEFKPKLLLGRPEIYSKPAWGSTYQSRLTLVHVFVTIHIDCCCSLLAGLPLGTLARLDRVQRSAARLIGGLSKFSSITAYMRDVHHWLPISTHG